MMAGLAASLAGTYMFIWRFVGLLPKSLTRVSAPFAVAVKATRLLTTGVERCILVENTFGNCCSDFLPLAKRQVYTIALICTPHIPQPTSDTGAILVSNTINCL
jgi:hypothetical protein